jgi:hypothetical protein
MIFVIFYKKIMKNLLLICLGILTFSCSSVRVFSDFDNSINFDNYKSFAFFKPGIEEVEISDLDKRRILKSIEKSLKAKKLVLSSNPDLLINISVKATDRLFINPNNGWDWGWNPWLYNSNFNSISVQTRGELFIDIIDSKSKLLVWQGKGYGGINEYMKNRDERINLFVSEILKNYPPVDES